MQSASAETVNEAPVAEVELRAQARQSLHKLWLPGRDDPATLQADLRQLADYIALRPAALELLQSLDGKALRLRYRAGAFSTRVSATAFTVHSATIYFDPRTAAYFADGNCGPQLSDCIASPADALLHELLHARAALLDSQQFLRSVVPGSAIYPRAHERDVIAKERELFTRLGEVDAMARPLRQSHAGTLVPVRCVTCTES